MSVIIRQATPADADVLLDLSIITLTEAFAHQNTEADFAAYVAEAFTAERIRNELADPGTTFWLAKHEAEVVGYAKLRSKTPKPRRLAGKRSTEIQRLYVLNRAQGLGLGRKLMETCLQTARDEDFQTVFLGVWEKNFNAQAFYQHLGFQPCGWHYFQFGSDRQRDYWMSLDL